jgi:prepilin-type N-terminal cleavage/methylation domain-containing protein
LKNYFKTETGFTLAEVLITLLIIGVIAGLVIPAIVQDTQDAELKVAYKKAFSDLSQVTNRIFQDNGGTLKGLCPQSNPGGDICWKNIYKPYLNIVKECSNGTNIGNCWSNMGGGKGAKYYDGTDYVAYTAWWGNNTGLVLNNGVVLAFTGSASGLCDNNNTASSRCFHLWVDVNGNKGPNTFGKDVFFLQANALRLYPAIGFGESCSDDGFDCSTYYLKNP